MKDSSDLAAFSCGLEPNTDALCEFQLCALDTQVNDKGIDRGLYFLILFFLGNNN